MQVIFSKNEYIKLESGAYRNSDKTTYGFSYCPVEAGYSYNELQIDNWTFCNDPDRNPNDEEPERIIIARNITHKVDEEGSLVITIDDCDWGRS